MIHYDVIYASRQRHAELIAEANPRPVEGITIRFDIVDRVAAALKAVFAKLQPKQAPAMHKGLATH